MIPDLQVGTPVLALMAGTFAWVLFIIVRRGVACHSWRKNLNRRAETNKKAEAVLHRRRTDGSLIDTN